MTKSIFTFSFCFFSICFVLLTFFVKDHPFFWDTVQFASKHGHWFYENGFINIILPNELDSGNQPFFGMYIALVWKIFGKSLPASHFAMLPFLIGIVCQLQILSRRFFDSPLKVFLVMLLILVEPTLLGQSALVSPDIALCFFYLLCINSIFNGNRIWLAAGLIGLSEISMRGTFLLLSVFITHLNIKPADSRVRLFSAYIPALVLALSWFTFHFSRTGWTGYHEQSPWIDSFRMNSSARDFYQSVKMLLYVLFDYGKIATWIITGVSLYYIYKRKQLIKTNGNVKTVCLLFLVPLLVIVPTKLLYIGLMQSRYYLPVFIFLHLAVVYFLFNFHNKKVSHILYFFILLFLISGHFWVYPERISQNWDGTLAHLPYHHLREKMIRYLDEKNIPFHEVASDFPNVSEIRYTDLNDDRRHFAEKEKNRLHQHKYVFYSNVFNGFTVEELNELNNKWVVEQEYRFLTVYVKLFKNRN